MPCFCHLHGPFTVQRDQTKGTKQLEAIWLMPDEWNHIRGAAELHVGAATEFRG